MDRVRYVGAAAIVASCAAGPLAMLMAGIRILQAGNPVHVDLDLIAVAPGTLVMATVFGWLFAIVPNLLGTMVLGWFGRFNVGMRTPTVWAIVGAAAAGIPAWLATGPYDSYQTSAAMTGIGAASALLCRARVKWEENEAAGRLAAPPDFTPARPQATP